MPGIRRPSASPTSAASTFRCSIPLLEKNVRCSVGLQFNQLVQIGHTDTLHLPDVIGCHVHDSHLRKLPRREMVVPEGAVFVDAFRGDAADAEVGQLTCGEVREARAAQLADVLRLHADHRHLAELAHLRDVLRRHVPDPEVDHLVQREVRVPRARILVDRLRRDVEDRELVEVAARDLVAHRPESANRIGREIGGREGQQFVVAEVGVAEGTHLADECVARREREVAGAFQRVELAVERDRSGRRVQRELRRTVRRREAFEAGQGKRDAGHVVAPVVLASAGEDGQVHLGAVVDLRGPDAGADIVAGCGGICGKCEKQSDEREKQSLHGSLLTTIYEALRRKSTKVFVAQREFQKTNRVVPTNVAAHGRRCTISNPQKKDWVNILFLTLTPVIGVAGTALYTWRHGFHWWMPLLTVTMYALVGMSICAGYHRFFSHKSYECSPFVQAFYAFFGAMAGQHSSEE